MIYEAYQEKVTKVANFLKKIFKHMALIIGTLSVAVLLLISFLATKGMMLGEIEIDSSKLIYGEKISVNAKALFSDVEFEYTDFGKDEWSTTPPTLAGKYEVRAKSKASFGRYKYSENVEFSISPRDITVQILDTSVTYGENPAVIAQLVDKDEIECREYTYEDIGKNSTNVEAKKDSITIYNANGKDVTSCYNITTEPSKIDILKRPIQITVSSQSMVYNGTTLAYDGYEISGGSLGFADRLGAEFNSSITEVGSVVNTPDLVVRNREGVDVTFHYDVKVNVGKLTVTQRPVVVITPTEDKTYDGEELSNGKLEIYYGEGETDMEIPESTDTEEETDMEIPEYTTEGIVEWETEYPYPETTDGESIDIEIEPMRPEDCNHFDFDEDGLCDICFTEISGNVGWDTDYVTEESTYSNIAEDHYYKEYQTYWSEEYTTYLEELVYIEYPYHYDVNHDAACDFCGNNKPIDHAFKDKNGDGECDRCLETIHEFGKVIEPALYSRDVVYENVSNPRYEIDTTKDGVIAGHNILIKTEKLPSITNVGSISNVIHVNIVDADGNDKTSNYSLFYDFGTLTVNPRKLTVTTPTEEWVYDGESHSTNYTFGEDNIAQNQICLPTMPTITNVGSIQNTPTFDILDASGNSVIENYEITTDFGTITVNKRKLTVTTDNGEWVYDGTAHTTPIVLGGDNIAIGQTYKTTAKEIITVGEIQNTVTIEIFDKNGESAIDNYEISTSFGNLSVTHRVINLSSPSYDGIYNGFAVSFGVANTTTDFNYESLASGESVVVTDCTILEDYTPEPVKNTLEYYIQNENGDDVTSNYKITENFGTFVIRKREFKYHSASYDEVYDGQDHTVGIVIENEEHVFEEMAFIPYVKHNGVTVNDYTPEPIINVATVAIFKPTPEGDKDISHNFEIEYMGDGKVNVRKRQFVLKTESGSWVYDGYTHSLEDPILTSVGGYAPIAQNQSIIVTKYPSVNDWTNGKIENKLEYHIENIQGEDVTYNYDITDIAENRGTLEITKRPLVYHTESYNGVYDGYERTFGIVIEDELEFYRNMAFTPQIKYTENKIKDAMDEPMANSFVVTVFNESNPNAEGIDVTYNFDINCIYEGTLFVDYRKIQIKTQSNTWKYDGYAHSLETPLLSTTEGYNPIAPEQSFIVTDYVTVKNWTRGKVENKLDYYIDDGFGNDVTYNYKIIDNDMGWGTLEITQRELSVATYGGTWTYDGMWHSNGTLYLGLDYIAEGDSYTVTHIPTVRNYTPVPVTNKVTFKILTSDGEDSIEKYQNYLIVEESYGTLTIDPLRVYFVSYTDELTYDGFNHAPDINAWASDTGEYAFGVIYNANANAYETTYSSCGDSLVISNYSAYKYYTDGGFMDVYFNISIYDAEDGSDSVNELGNYIIESISYGSIKINKRQLYYSTPTNISLIYNGQLQSATNVTFSKYGNNTYSGIATTDKVRIDGKTELIDYDGGNFIENVISFTIVDANGNDMSRNYEIYKKSHGLLRMNQRPVYVNTNSNAWEYDGLEHYDDGFKVNKTYIDGYDLVSGDKLTFGVFTTVVDVGRYTNNLSSPTVYSTVRGRDVTNNYRIVTNEADKGTLVINPRKISIKPVDAWKVYDGKYLTVSDWEYVKNSKYLLAGHYISSINYVNNSQIDVGLYYTGIYGAIIVDEYGNDISYRYELVGLYGTPDAVYGTLEIEKLKISITSGSAEKPYDGTPLTDHRLFITYINGGSISGDKISANFTGTITGVGITDNTFENVTVIDKYGNDVTENYDFEGNIYFGELEITRTVVGQIYSTETNYEYIKTESFGDYIGNGFASAPEYGMSNYFDLGPESLIPMAFRNMGYNLTKQIFISGISATAYYSDVYDSSFYFTYPNDLFGDVSILKGHLDILSGYEEDYRGWVYGAYTSIDYSTYTYLQGIIAEYGFDASNPSVYEDVALYIQSSATYGFSCADKLDSSGNVVISFLSHEYGDEGVCRHYAAAATMLYRALGIPARYTEGYLVETKAYEWVDITTPGHAWVEVYVDDLGWIPVEVTASDDNGFETNDGKTASGTVGGVMDEKPEQIKVHVKPVNMTFTYTGKNHNHNGSIETSNCSCGKDGVTLDYLASMGYEIRSGVSHDYIVDAGTYSAYISSIQIYYNGQNVTYKFDIVTHAGTVNVKRAPITLSFLDTEKVFDGTILYPSDQIGSWGNDFESWLKQGYRFEYSVSVNGEQGVINVGEYVADVNFTVYDPSGKEVTYNFDFSKACGGAVVVKPFEIQIYLYQNHKMYDGNTLTYASAFGGNKYYRVMNTLPEGFELANFEVIVELLDVRGITVEEFNENSHYYNYFVTDGIDDMSGNFAIKFVKLSYGETEIDYIPMQVTPRQITVTTATQTKVDDGNVLTNNSYVIGGAGVVEGEKVEVSVVGECVYPGMKVENNVDCVYIVVSSGYRYPYLVSPSNGEEVVIGNYKITFIYGMLEITEYW